MKSLKKSIENKLSFYKILLSLCAKNITILQLFSGIYDIYLGFKVKVDEYVSLIEQKLLITVGLAKDKKKTKILLAKLARKIAGAVHIYAEQIGDTVLAAKTYFTKTDLNTEQDSALVDVCNKILVFAQTYSGNIQNLGVDGNMIITFQTAIGLFDVKSPLPAEAIDHRTTLTRLIDEKVVEIDYYKKNQLDLAVLILEDDYPVFISDYNNASRVIKDGTRHEKKVEITPEEVGYLALNLVDKDGNPLEDAKLKLISGETVIEFDTDEDGDGYAEKVPPATYTLIIELFGYKTITVEGLVFTGNDEMEMDFGMEDEEVVPTPEV